MLGKEDLVILSNLSRLMAEKLEKPISHVRGWVNAQIKITAANLYYRMIRGARLPINLRYWETDWYLGSGLGLVQ